MQREFLICNLPRRLGGLSLIDLRHLCAEHNIHRTKSNNFLKTKRDVCLALTLGGIAEFKQKISEAAIIHPAFEELSNNSVVAAKQQFDFKLKNNSDHLKSLKQIKLDIAKESNKIADLQDTLSKHLINFDSNHQVVDIDLQNLKNRYNYKIEELNEKLKNLQDQEIQRINIQKKVQANNAFLRDDKENFDNHNLNDDVQSQMRIDIQRLKLHEQDIMVSLSELRDHVSRLKTEHASFPENQTISGELESLKSVKLKLESANRELKEQLEEKSQGLHHEEVEKVNEYISLLKNKDDEIKKISDQIDAFKNASDGDQNEINHLKEALKSSKIEAGLLTKYQSFFPNIDDAKKIFDSKKELENRAQKLRETLRSTELSVMRLMDRIDKMDEDSEKIIRTNSPMSSETMEAVFKRIDKILDKHSDARKEMASLQRQIKASDAKVKDFQNDFLELIKLTDEKIQVDNIHPGNRTKLIDGLKDFITNSKYLSKTIENLNANKGQTESKLSSVSDRMNKISTLLDDAEKTDMNQVQTGGVQIDLDTVLKNLDSFEERIKRLIDDRKTLISEIQNLKSKTDNINLSNQAETESSIHTLSAHNHELMEQLAESQTKFLKLHAKLRLTLDQLNNSSETNDSKYLKLKDTISAIVSEQHDVLEQVADIQAKIGHTDALQQAIQIDASNKIIRSPVIPTAPDMPQHELVLNKAAEELKIETLQKQAVADAILQHDESIQSLEDAKHQNAASEEEIAKLEAKIAEIETARSKAINDFHILEKSIADKVNLINRLQNQLADVQKQDTERLNEVKSALEEAYMSQIHSKDDTLKKLEDQLRQQEISDRQALREQESKMRQSSDASIEALTKEIDSLKNKKTIVSDRDAHQLIEQKAESLRHEQELHERFQKALAQKDTEMENLQRSFQDRLKSEHDRLEVSSDSPNDHLGVVATQSHFLENMHSIEASWRERYDKLNNEYEQLRQRYQTEIDAAREKALAYEADVQQKSSEKFLQYNEAIRKTEQLEQQLAIATDRNQNLAGKAEEFMNNLIETKKELEQTKLQITDKRRLEQVIDDLTTARNELQDKKQIEEERDHELKIARKYAEDLGRKQEEFEQDRYKLDALKAKEKQNVKLIEDLHKTINAEQINRQKFSEESNSFRNRLDEIKDVVKEFANVKTINFKDSHKIMSPDNVAAAVQTVKDIAQDYRFFRSDYDKVVGKMRDNIVSIVKTLTNGETIDLASIDRRAAAAMTKEDAKAELQRYKTMMMDELKRESDKRYEEARLTAIAYGAEDKFHNETEADIYKIFESSRTPEYYNEKLKILNAFITYITSTRQRVRSRAMSVFKGDDVTKQTNINKLQDFIKRDLQNIEDALKELNDEVRKVDVRTKKDSKDSKLKDDILSRLQFLIKLVNNINEFKPEDIFDTASMGMKAIQEYAKIKDAYVIEVDAAISLMIQRAGLNQQDIEATNLIKFGDGKPPTASKTVYSVLDRRVRGGTISNDILTDALLKVKASRSEFEKSIMFFLLQWEEINGRNPDLSSYSKTLASLRGSTYVPSPDQQAKKPEAGPSISRSKTSDSSSASSQVSDEDVHSMKQHIINLYETLVTKGLLKQIKTQGIFRSPASGKQVQDIFDCLIDYAIHAFIQQRVWGKVNDDTKTNLRNYYLNTEFDKIFLSVTQGLIPSNTDTFEINDDDDVSEIFAKLTKLKSNNQSGGKRSSQDDFDREMTVIVENLKILKDQQIQSTAHLKDLLAWTEKQLVAMMKLRPRKLNKRNEDKLVGGVTYDDDRIDVREVRPYDVDKLNIVLEGLNKLIQTQMKEMKSLRASSKEGKEFKARVEKLDRLLVEKDVALEQQQEILSQSIDRALELEDELINRDTIFERLKLVILGVRVDDNKNLYFDKTRNAFKMIQNADHSIKYPQLLWELTISDPNPIIKSSKGIKQIKSWFESIKDTITVQMIFDIFEDAMTCQHYLSESTAFTSENQILTQILKLKQDIKDTLVKLSYDPYDDARATLDDLKLLNKRWYQDVVAPKMRDGLMAFQNEMRSKLYRIGPDILHRKTFEAQVKAVAHIAQQELQKVITTVHNKSDLLLTANVITVFQDLINSANNIRFNQPALRAQEISRVIDVVKLNYTNTTHDDNDIISREVNRLESLQHHLSQVWTSDIKWTNVKSLQFFDLENFRQYLSTQNQILTEDIIKGFDEANIMKSRKSAIQTQLLVGNKFALFDDNRPNWDYPDASALDGNATNLKPGFFDKDLGYPVNRLDSWVLLSTESDLTNYDQSIIDASRDAVMKESAKIATVIDIFGSSDQEIYQSYAKLCSALKCLGCIFMFYDLSHILIKLQGSIDDIDNFCDYLGSRISLSEPAVLDPHGERFKGFIPLLRSFIDFVQSSLSNSNFLNDSQKLNKEITIINQARSLVTDAETILNTLSTETINGRLTTHLENLIRTEMTNLTNSFQITFTKTFDEYLRLWDPRRQRGGVRFNDTATNNEEHISNEDSDHDSFFVRALKEVFDQGDKLIPVFRSAWNKFTNNKVVPSTSDLIDTESRPSTLREMQTLFETLNIDGIDKKLSEISDLRKSLQSNQKQETLPALYNTAIQSMTQELNTAELFLIKQKETLREKMNKSNEENAKTKLLEDEGRKKSETLLSLATENAELKEKNNKLTSPNKILYAYIRSSTEDQSIKPETNTNKSQTRQQDDIKDAYVSEGSPVIADTVPSVEISSEAPSAPPNPFLEPDTASTTTEEMPSAPSLQSLAISEPILEPNSPPDFDVNAIFANDSPPISLDDVLNEASDSLSKPGASVLIGDLNSLTPIPDDQNSPVNANLDFFENQISHEDWTGYDEFKMFLDQQASQNRLTESQQKRYASILNRYKQHQLNQELMRISEEIKQIKISVESAEANSKEITRSSEDFQTTQDMLKNNLQRLKTDSDVVQNLEPSPQLAVIKTNIGNTIETINQLSATLSNLHDNYLQIQAKAKNLKTIYEPVATALQTPMPLTELKEYKPRLDEIQTLSDELRSIPNSDYYYVPDADHDITTLKAAYVKSEFNANKFAELKPVASDKLQRLQTLLSSAESPLLNLNDTALLVRATINELGTAMNSYDSDRLLSALQKTNIDSFEAIIQASEAESKKLSKLKDEKQKYRQRFEKITQNIDSFSKSGRHILNKFVAHTGKQQSASQLFEKMMDKLQQLRQDVSRKFDDSDKMPITADIMSSDISNGLDFLEQMQDDADKTLTQMEQLLASDDAIQTAQQNRWKKFSADSFSHSRPEYAALSEKMLNPIKNLRLQFSPMTSQQGGSVQESWSDKLKAIKITCIEIYFYIIQFIRLPSILRLISTSQFCAELAHYGVDETSIKEFMAILFVDLSDLPKELTAETLQTSRQFWHTVDHDTITYKAQVETIGLHNTTPIIQVRSDEYFKFVIWLMDQQSQAIIRDPDRYQQLLLHIDDACEHWVNLIINNTPVEHLHNLRLPSIDSQHVENGVSRVLTYVRVRCDQPAYWNERFRLSWNGESKHEMFVEFNNHTFPYYDHSNLTDSWKNVTSLSTRCFRENKGSLSRALSRGAPYEYQYLMGPFSKIFTPDISMDQIARECDQIKETLLHGNSVFIIGYGASGAGKTSTLVCKSGSRDCSFKDSGVLLHLMQDKQIVSQFPNVSLTVHELFAGIDDPRSGDALADSRKIKDMCFQYSEAAKAYVFDTRIKYRHSANTSTSSSSEKRKGVRRYSMNAPEYFDDKYVNVVNSNLFNVQDDLDLTSQTTLSRVIKQALDDDRLTRATLNNPNSSRSHVLILIRLMDDQNINVHDDSSPYLIIGDFAGVENTFACQDLNTLVKMYNQKSETGERKYQEHIIDEDIAANADPDKFLKGGAADFQLYADSKEPSLDDETNDIVRIFQENNDCHITPRLINDMKLILKDYRAVFSFKSEKHQYLNLLVNSETDIYKNNTLSSINAKIADPINRAIRLMSALTKENALENCRQFLLTEFADEHKIQKLTDSNQNSSPKTRLNYIADAIDTDHLFKKYPIAPIWGVDTTLISKQRPPSKTASPYFASIVTTLREKYSNFFKHFELIEDPETSVQCFLKAIIRKHMCQIKKRSDEVNNMIRVCKARTYEGIYINDSLAIMRDVLKKLIMTQSRDSTTLRITPPFPDLCLPLYCNPLVDECFQSSEELDQYDSTADLSAKAILKSRSMSASSISSIIFDTLGESAKSLKIAIFCVFLMNRTVNDPPPTPFIDAEDLRLEISRLHNRASILAMLGTNIKEQEKAIDELSEFFNTDRKPLEVKKEVVEVLESSISQQRQLLGEGTCDEMLKRLKDGEWQNVLNMIDRANATHPIGTLQFVDSMAKYSMTDFSCRLTNESHIPFARDMHNTLINNLNNKYNEISAMTDMMETNTFRLSEYYKPPADPCGGKCNQCVYDSEVQPATTSTQELPISATTQNKNLRRQPSIKQKSTKAMVSKVNHPNPKINKKSKQDGGLVKEKHEDIAFDPKDFDELIKQWPDADGRNFSDFLAHAYMDRPSLLTKPYASIKKPRRRTRR